MKEADQVKKRIIKKCKRKRTLSSKEGKNAKCKTDSSTASSNSPVCPSIEPEDVDNGAMSKEEQGPSTEPRTETIFSNTLLNNILNEKKKEFLQSTEVQIFLQSRIKPS